MFKPFLRRATAASKIQQLKSSTIRPCTGMLGQRSMSSQKLGVAADQHLWVHSPHPAILPVTGKTIPEFLSNRMLEWGNRPAVECGLSGRSYTYTELDKHSQGFAAGLLKSGFQRGDGLAIILPNMPEYIVALLGSWRVGMLTTTVNPAYTALEFETQLKMAGSKVLLTTEHFLPLVLKAKESCPLLKSIIVIGGAQPPEGCLSFFDLMKTDARPYQRHFVSGAELDTKNEISLLPYSSGTTGPPKGVELTHESMISNMLQMAEPDVMATTPVSTSGVQDRTMGVLPIFHMAGMTIVLFGLYQGCHLVTLPKFDPTTFIPTFKRHKPTNITVVPPLLQFLCQVPQLERSDIQSLNSLCVGAAPVGQVLIDKLLEKAGKYIFVQEAFGMTELTAVSHLSVRSSKNGKIGSCGPPVGSTVCKVVDVETGETVGENKPGEIWTKGPQIMKGYFKNEKATAETLMDGWMKTGDIGYYDDTRHFYIVDRLKELIKVKGFQVAPSELENILRKHPGVADIGVIGVPCDKAGELPRAYIVPRDEKVDAEEINHFLSDKVSEFKQLKGGIEFVKIIPKTASGKIIRRQLLAEYKAANGLS